MQDDKTIPPDSQEPEKQNKLDKYLWLGFPAVVFAWLVYGYFQGTLQTDSSFDRLNALFSGLAFWGVIWAILLQKRELAFQRKELELTRGEVRGQKEQLQTQNVTLKQQRFENTFFSLLGLFNSIVNSIEITRTAQLGEPPYVYAKGRECFSTFVSEFSQLYSNEQSQHADWGHRTLCMTAYEFLAGTRQSFVGHYFRTLYNIVKFIATSEVENKQPYINILRAQLSSSELTLLFYNCISKYGSEKFTPLVEKFGLLENMDFSRLLDQRHRELFNESAFHSPP